MKPHHKTHYTVRFWILLLYLQCAKKHNIDYEPIRKCAAGPEGNRLEHEMFLRTAATEPQQEYVPWIIVNGVSSQCRM